MRILVVRGGAIGDFILTLPAMEALRYSGVACREEPRPLEILGYPSIAQLALAGRLADALERIEAPWFASFFMEGANLDSKAVAYFQRFDLIVSYVSDPDGVFGRNVRRCTSARFIAAIPRPPENGVEHAAHFFLKPIEAMGFHASPIPVLNLPDSSHVKWLSGRWLVAHPGSGSEKKNWPEPLWKTFLLEWLKRTDWNILLIGGEAEEQRLGRLAASLPNARCRLVFNLPLVDLALLMRQTQGFLGHDSGMTHLAAALGLRGCVLWGMTNEAVWHPASDRFKVLRADNGLSELHPETVHLELAQWLGLPPSA